MRYITAIVFAAFLVVLFIALAYVKLVLPLHRLTVQRQPVPIEHVKARMRYHGTLIAFKCGNGWCFKRDGQTVRLW